MAKWQSEIGRFPRSLYITRSNPFVAVPRKRTAAFCSARPTLRRWYPSHTAQRTEVLMSGQHFRFLHAGGFLLDQPLRGLVEIPEPLTELLIDTPFSAAQRVFD